ncbi:histidine kinase [Lentzea sp. E54]|uniref:histidine kinase n=1 Tax=Lentzea xerophila TaxID=3435883 RepID=UPI003DA20537
MIKPPRTALTWGNFASTRLRAPCRKAADLRREFERSLHDGPALQASALALELELISVATDDPHIRARLDTAQNGVRRMLDDMRGLGEMLYPPVLPGAGVGPAVRAAGERLGLFLTLDVAAEECDGTARSRICLMIIDHLSTLRPGTAVSVRVRAGRRLAWVRVTQDAPGEPGPRRHWAVIRCG